MYTNKKVYRCAYIIISNAKFFVDYHVLETDILFHSVIKINSIEVLRQWRLWIYSMSQRKKLQDICEILFTIHSAHCSKIGMSRVLVFSIIVYCTFECIWIYSEQNRFTSLLINYISHC